MFRGRIAVAVAVTITVGAMPAGCGTAASQGGSSPSESASATQAAAQQQNLAAYFNAFGTERSQTMQPMLTAASPGSPAAVYAQHQINNATAEESDNSASDPSTVTIADGKVTIVVDVPKDSTDAVKKAATTVYQDFQFDPSGLIVTWTADPGGPLAPRIHTEKGTVTRGGVTVLLQTAYQTNLGALALTGTVTNRSKSKASVTSPGYTNPDRRQVQVSSTPYQADPVPGGYAVTRLVITGGAFGGKLTAQFDYQTTAQIPVS